MLRHHRWHRDAARDAGCSRDRYRTSRVPESWSVDFGGKEVSGLPALDRVAGIAPGDDVHVDRSLAGQPGASWRKGAPPHPLLSTGAPAGADDDLGDLAGTGEVDERLGGIVGPDLVPLGAH